MTSIVLRGQADPTICPTRGRPRTCAINDSFHAGRLSGKIRPGVLEDVPSRFAASEIAR
jgi:hypothetical protein